MSEDFEKVFEELYEKGMTDGLPIFPPSKERVKKMLEYTDKSTDESLGKCPPSNYDATVGSVAANAVMAGCKPEYFPVVIAAVEALLDRPNLRATSGRSEPLAIVNGPIAKEIGISAGKGFFTQPPVASPARRPNMTIGRTLWFIEQNIGQCAAENVELGLLNRRGMVISEDEDNSPWEPLHVERGFKRDTSTVTVFAEKGLHGHRAAGGRDSGIFSVDLRAFAKALIPETAHQVTSPIGGSTCLFIMGHNTAKYFANNGMGKDELRRYFYENCRMRWKDWYPEYPMEIRENILRSAFATAPSWMRDLDLVPVFPNYGKDIWFVVAGGEVAMRNVAVAEGDHGFDSCVTKPILLKDGSSARSVYDFKHNK